MARWEPNAPQRLAMAALELFAERGYENTPGIDIAQRAGLTKSTFFRHFQDKREVLFGDGTMPGPVAEALPPAPPTPPRLHARAPSPAAAGGASSPPAPPPPRPRRRS